MFGSIDNGDIFRFSAAKTNKKLFSNELIRAHKFQPIFDIKQLYFGNKFIDLKSSYSLSSVALEQTMTNDNDSNLNLTQL